jgi:ABC-type molybdate transport system ATPase subunit
MEIYFRQNYANQREKFINKEKLNQSKTARLIRWSSSNFQTAWNSPRIITKDSAERLNLSVGKTVYAVVKASDVMIATD